RPLRTYSSGMRARLAFGIATLDTPEIMLIDEALAVGDRRFRRKSLQRLREMQQSTGTLVMVTHNLEEVRQTCSRAIWLDQGVQIMDGPADEIVDAYNAGGD
ncbi:MAG: ABC transporter ATP-binding protein, partial [Actinomycetota bacterium]